MTSYRRYLKILVLFDKILLFWKVGPGDGSKLTPGNSLEFGTGNGSKLGLGKVSELGLRNVSDHRSGNDSEVFTEARSHVVGFVCSDCTDSFSSGCSVTLAAM